MFIKQPNAVTSAISRRIPYVEIQNYGSAAPLEITGTLHGMEFYFRSRHGYAHLNVGHNLHRAPLYMANSAIKEFIESDDPELETFFCDLVANLMRAPRLWEFAGCDGKKYGAWGQTSEEAWQRMHKPSDYLISKGILIATQEQWLADRQMNPKTITVDDRVWPNPDPVFEVHS